MSRNSVLAWIANHLRPMWRMVLGGLTLAMLGGLLSSLDPLLMRHLIDSELPQRHVAGSLVLVFAIVACLAGNLALLLWSMYMNFSVEQRVAQQIRIALLEQLNRMSSEFHEHTPVGDNMTRLGADADQIAQFGSEMASSIVRAMVFFAINVAVMAYLNAFMTLVVVPSFILFSWVQRRFTDSMAARGDSAQKETGHATSVLYEYVSHVPQIQLLCAEKVIMLKAISVWSRMMQARKGQKRTELAYAGWINASFLLSTLLVLGIGSYEAIRGVLTIGALVAFYAYQTRVFEPLSVATELYSRVQRVGASVRRVRAVIDSEPVVQDLGHISHPSPIVVHGLILDDVRYAYPGSRIALSGISLRIAVESSIGIVGPSGSGKSTLARLLVRMCDPDRGEIRLDGYPLPQYSLATLRQTICYVPQKPVLFNGTIRENLLYGKASATASDLDRVIEITQLAPILRRLSSGLDAQLGPSGSCLSGGEIQRLALARALLRDAPVLVLDEATSALDLPTEQAVLRAISECRLNILVVISHRIASITWMDQIIVLRAGQIADVGCHQELYQRFYLYRNLCNTQMSLPENVSDGYSSINYYSDTSPQGLNTTGFSNQKT